MRVAVIGAGMAGLSAAWYLRRAGHKILLFERHYKPGGRMNSRRKAGLVVDHGERFIYRDSPVLRELILDCGLQSELCPIDKPIYTLRANHTFAQTAQEATDLNRATFRDGMLMLPEALRRQLGGYFSIAVKGLERDAESDQFVIHTEPPIRVGDTMVDAVVVGVPAGEALKISHGVHGLLNADFLKTLEKVQYSRCITLIAALEEVTLPEPFFGLEPTESGSATIGWIAFEDLKCEGRGVKGWTSLVIHATAASSRLYWDMADEKVLAMLYREAAKLVPQLPSNWLWARVKRWETARLIDPSEIVDFARYTTAPPGVLIEFCGDYRGGDGAESAALSGRRAAEILIQKNQMILAG